MRIFLLSIGLAAIAGCASTSASTAMSEQRIHANAAVAAVEQLHQSDPRVEKHIAQARDDISKGDEAMDDGEEKVAFYYYDRAVAFADTAMSWAYAGKAKSVVGMGEGGAP